MSNQTTNRHAKGSPVGGRFAAGSRPSAAGSVTLAPEAQESEQETLWRRNADAAGRELRKAHPDLVTEVTNDAGRLTMRARDGAGEQVLSVAVVPSPRGTTYMVTDAGGTTLPPAGSASDAGLAAARLRRQQQGIAPTRDELEADRYLDMAARREEALTTVVFVGSGRSAVGWAH